MMVSANRRRFLEQTLVGGMSITAAAHAPHGWLHAAAGQAAGQDRILVVIQLSGGNDGLNTIVPYQDPAYYRARPKLAIPADEVLKVDDAAGLHPATRALEALLNQSRMCILQGVGYATPNRSHFESMDIWHTCQSKQQRNGQGWLGHWLSQMPAAPTDSALGLHLGREQQPLALAGRNITIPSIASLEQFRLQLGNSQALKAELLRLARAGETPSPQPATGPIAIGPSASLQPETTSELLDFVQASTRTAVAASQRLEAAASASKQSSDFPATPLGEKLQIVAQLIVSELPTRVYYVTLDGFDTHAQQSAAHAGLLRQWSDALGAMVRYLEERDQADRVLVMTFSEFGRRVAENASAGTDHGAAAPVFLAGPKCTQPVFGGQPSLTDLDDGDLKFHTDFRSVYATILERWFSGTSEPVLGGRYPVIDVFS